MGTKVVIARRWSEPKVRVSINSEKNGGIHIEIPIDDFKESLRQEIGSVTWVFGQKAWNSKYGKAFDSVMAFLREQSKYSKIPKDEPVSNIPTYFEPISNREEFREPEEEYPWLVASIGDKNEEN